MGENDRSRLGSLELMNIVSLDRASNKAIAGERLRVLFLARLQPGSNFLSAIA